MKKATIEFNDYSIIVDGMVITLNVIPQILYELAHPDPRKWYRFERVGNQCIVHVELRDPAELNKPFPLEVSNGNYVGERGRSSEDAGSEGKETPHPHDEHRPN